MDQVAGSLISDDGLVRGFVRELEIAYDAGLMTFRIDDLMGIATSTRQSQQINTRRHVVYPRGFGCPRIRSSDRDRQVADLENATYRFLDHAMDFGADSRRVAFRLLAEQPYPLG
jgi:hypothetical protein